MKAEKRLVLACQFLSGLALSFVDFVTSDERQKQRVYKVRKGKGVTFLRVMISGVYLCMKSSTHERGPEIKIA
ncbi:hypothetical protein PanWU01x14_347330 [Parasponia andersonii]|uniref:Uncharacterized protein n=1 Tax=Parasponia andersonii TaxID=3476 RepID=A0A2P5AC27_PARAD|nr:hypothetical protein PanWU01x14_347330 [Parasponia andersonii]